MLIQNLFLSKNFEKCQKNSLKKVFLRFIIHFIIKSKYEKKFILPNLPFGHRVFRVLPNST